MSDKARILRRCTHMLLFEVTHFRSLGIPYSQRSNGGGGSTEALTASAGQVSLPPLAFSLREPSGGHGYLERSWEEPRLSTGEMLAEWAECAEGRCAACLLGDVDWERALALVRDRDLRFFFFSWGLLKGKCSCQGMQRDKRAV